MSVVISNPQKIKIENVGTVDNSFVPYKENFTCALAAGKAVEFEVKSASEALYYSNLAIKDLAVSLISSFDEEDDNILVIKSSTTITLSNGTPLAVSFVPYKENFTQAIASGDSVTIPAANVNQFLYYLKQSANTDITVDYQ